jgi:hypothetical protein
LEEGIVKRGFKIALVALLTTILAVPLALLYVSEIQGFIFFKSLQVSDFIVSGESYMANVSDSEDVAADIYVRLEHPAPNSFQRPMLVSIAHSEDTELDSITFRFSAEPYVISVYVETLSVPLLSKFGRDGAGLGVTFSTGDLGFYGTGTVPFSFILVSDRQGTELRFTMEFSMHRKTFLQLTSLKVHTYLSMPIPS